MIFIYFYNFQSPAESLTTDSRPGSVLDEGESNSEPPESMISLSKEVEEKDPLCIALPETPSSDTQTKDDTADNEMSPSNVATPDDEADIPAQSSKTVEEENENKVEKNIADVPIDSKQESKVNTNETLPPKLPVTLPLSNNNNTSTTSTPTSINNVKEQEMLAKLANMKQEISPALSTPKSDPNFTPKESIYIKKEPTDSDSMTDTNANSQEAHDLKLKIEVKSEIKCNNNSNSNNNSSSSSSSDNSNQMPNEQDNNNNAENLVCKPTSVFENKYNPVAGGPPHNTVSTGTDIKFGPLINPLPSAPPSIEKIESDSRENSRESGKYGNEGADYTMKTFIEQQQRDSGTKHDVNKREGPSPISVSPEGQLMKPYPPSDAPTMKPYSSNDLEMKPYPSGPPLINSGPDGINKSQYPVEHPPPSLMRHPFEHGMMKFDPSMMKYELPPPSGQELKYMPPEHIAAAMKYEGALKSHFSADNLIKGSSHYPADLKYPHPSNDGPLDVSSRITPHREDSQGSNSNSQPPTLPSPSIQSPLTSQSSLIPSAPPSAGLFVGHPGLNLSGSHLPANHPSLMLSSSSIGGHPSGPHMLSQPPTSGSSPFLPIQPTNLSALHRPHHQDMPGSRIYPPISTMSSSMPPSSHPSISTSGGFMGPGGHSQSPLYATSRLSDNHRDALHARTSPLGPMQLHGSPHPLLSHPLPMHLVHPGMGLPPHHPAAHLPPHLAHSHLMQPLGPNTPLPLLGGPQPSTNPLTSLIEAAGRRTPTSSTSSINHMVPSSQHNSVIQSPSAGGPNMGSSLSRSSPLVSAMHHSSTGAFSHRPQSPNNSHPANLSRSSPLHLGSGQQSGPHGPSPAAISERERHLMRQQSPHMTPPPTSSASSMIASPLSKMYGPPGSQQQSGQQQQRPNSPPPQGHHFRPGASPPVVRHPQMPLPLPMMGQSVGLHPGQSPYPHHLLHQSMFYGHNPFNPPYPYSPYGPPPGAFSYMKPGSNPLDNPMLSHHPTSIPPPRSDEPPSPHANGPKSVTSMHDKIKSPAPSKGPQNNHSNNQPGGGNQGGGGGGGVGGPQPGQHGPYSSPYQPSHPFMENTLPPGKTSHIEALRAHAASAAGLGPGGPGGHHATEPVHIDAVDIEPDPEPPSPVHNIDRGPSPEAKPDDTECHRSQSAM